MVEFVMATALAVVLGGVAAIVLQQVQAWLGEDTKPAPIKLEIETERKRPRY